MKSTLSKKVEEFEHLRTQLLDKLDQLDQDTLNARPIEGKWSILEIAEHLAVAESEVLHRLPEFELLIEQKQSLRNAVMYRIVMFVLGAGIKVKVPSRKMLPQGNLSLHEIRESWDRSQAWFRGYMEGLDEQGLRAAVFNHPVAGPLNVVQAVDMSLAHIKTHLRQINTRLELLKNSAAI